MRPRSYERRPTDAHTSSRTHLRTYTRTRRKFSDNKSALQHCQTEFNHQSDTIHFYYPIAVQSIFILTPHWLRHLYKLSISVTHLPSISNYLPTIQSSLTHLPNYSHLLSLPPIISHASYTIFIRFLSQPLTSPSFSICQYVIKPCQFSIYLPHSHIQQFFHLSSPYQIHYNHFHYGNRIPSQSSAIPIMHNYSFIDFRNEIRLKPFCIIIHLNCINIHLFDFHYGNHLLIIGFYYGIHLWNFISHHLLYNHRAYKRKK